MIVITKQMRYNGAPLIRTTGVLRFTGKESALQHFSDSTYEQIESDPTYSRKWRKITKNIEFAEEVYRFGGTEGTHAVLITNPSIDDFYGDVGASTEVILFPSLEKALLHQSKAKGQCLIQIFKIKDI